MCKKIRKNIKVNNLNKFLKNSDDFDKTTIYIDDIEDKNRYIVEMHFEDWNYYEIELTDEDVVDEIVENLQKPSTREVHE